MVVTVSRFSCTRFPGNTNYNLSITVYGFPTYGSRSHLFRPLLPILHSPTFSLSLPPPPPFIPPLLPPSEIFFNKPHPNEPLAKILRISILILFYLFKKSFSQILVCKPFHHSYIRHPSLPPSSPLSALLKLFPSRTFPHNPCAKSFTPLIKTTPRYFLTPSISSTPLPLPLILLNSPPLDTYHTSTTHCTSDFGFSVFRFLSPRFSSIRF